MITEPEIITTNRFNNNNLFKKKSITTDRKGVKSPNIVNIKNNVEKANIDDCINEIKKEYEKKVKALYRSVWIANLKFHDLSMFNLNAEIDTNYFIKLKYYAPFNLKDTIISAIKQNADYKAGNERILITQNDGLLSPNNAVKNSMQIARHDDIADLSASAIAHIKKDEKEDVTLSFSSEINLFESNITKQRDTTNNNCTNKSDNSSINTKIIERREL